MSKVTIVIPAYNAGPLLTLAVASALGQSWPDLEVIVVDDGSTDGSPSVVESYNNTRLRVIRQSNVGKSVAMNRAISEASGDFYCILDADDEMYPDRVARQAAALEENPDVAAVFCGHELLIGRKSLAPRMRSKGRRECQADIDALRMPAHDPTGMYRLKLVRDVLYEPTLHIGQGYDYILRVGERWPMLVVGECLYRYRVGRRSATTAHVQAREDAVREVRRRACERRGIVFDESAFTGPRRSRNRIADNGISTHCLESVVDLRALGRHVEGFRVGFYAASLHPLDWQYYRPLMAALLPEPILRQVRSRKGQD